MKDMRRRKKLGNYAFIDSQNLNLGVQKAGWKMDWRKFRQYLQDEYNVSCAFMFIGYMQENESLYEQMHAAGYSVVLKPTIDMKLIPELADQQVAAESQKYQTKGNVDADLVLYAMKELPNYHKAIIVSGDGDFYGLVEYLAEQKKLLHVLSPNWQYSSLLKPFEPYIVRVDQLKRELAYYDRKKFKPKETKAS
jgi:uncharacterized LabA/DUF88 family protein